MAQLKYSYYTKCANPKPPCTGQVEEVSEMVVNGEQLVWASKGFFCTTCGVSYGFEGSPDQQVDNSNGRFNHMLPKNGLKLVMPLPPTFDPGPGLIIFEEELEQLEEKEEEQTDV